MSHKSVAGSTLLATIHATGAVCKTKGSGLDTLGYLLRGRIWSNSGSPLGKTVVSEFSKRRSAVPSETVQNWVGCSIIYDQVMC